MDRTLFYQKETVVDGTSGDMLEEYDYIHNNLSFFVMNYNPIYYTVEEGDIGRPDLISYKTYKTVSYWWLICYINGIKDPFLEMTSGKLLVIPSILDIYDFYKKYRVVR